MPRLLQIAQLGNPVLRLTARHIDNISSPEISDLAADMLATLLDSNGIGIAAPQVYESKRILIISCRPNQRYPNAPVMEPTVIINPEVLENSGESIVDWEGCLSVPGIRGLVPRARIIKVRYADMSGKTFTREFSDFLARVFLHELDHLDGIVFLDRVTDSRDLMMEKEYQKMMAEKVQESGGVRH